MTAVIAAGGIGVIGVGAAAATGVLTPGADKAFSDWENIDPADAILIAELPGPGTTTVAAYEAPDHGNGQTCIAFIVFGDPAYGNRDVGGECSNRSSDDMQFGRSGGWASSIEVPGEASITIFATTIGDATSAELEYHGTAHEVAVGEGYAVGWAPDSAWSAATLIARDANGSVVGEIHDFGSEHATISAPSSSAPTTPK